MTTPERSVEEIVEEFEKHYFTEEGKIVFGGFNGIEIKDWLTQTIQAERQKREGVVEANADWNKVTKSEIRTKAEEATSEMLRSLKEDDLDQSNKDEWYGYIRGVRDMVYSLNCQEKGKSKTQSDLEEALQALTQPNNPK